MTWTYGGDPSASDRDALRFEIGDTDSTDELLQNEELDYLLTREGSVVAAAVPAAEALLAKFARLTDKSVGDLKLSYSQRRAQYEALLGRLRRRLAGSASVLPYAGGLSASRKEDLRNDSDLVQPDFRRDQFRNPRRGEVDDDERRGC